VVRERGKGFEDAIAKYPDMKIVVSKYCQWDSGVALAFVEDALVNNPDIVGAWAHWDDGILPAVKVLKEQGKINKVTTVGMGFYSGGPDLIKEGSLTASWEMHADQLGSYAGDAAIKLFNGEKVDKKVNVPMDMVTKENIDKFYKK
jgi:ABC-type sugar transport system substrate-binding protein